jgi:hypothetical protein
MHLVNTLTVRSLPHAVEAGPGGWLSTPSAYVHGLNVSEALHNPA